MTESVTQIIRGARLRGRAGTFDMALEGERIAAVEEHLETPAEREYDAAGGLLVPGFVNAHQHLDKCMLGPVMRPNRSQTLQEAIEITWDHKRAYTVEEIAARAQPVLEEAIRHGTSAMRAFADVDTIGGLTPVEALLEVKRRFQGLIAIEVVAFPQEAIIRDPGCQELMDQAMDLGADVVGGLPWYERSDRHVHEHIDFCFELADRYAKDIHMLVDDTDDPTSRSLEYLALRTIETGYQGRVTASHCGALAAYDDNHATRVIALVREAEMTICSNAHISLVLDGRADRGLIRRGITRVRELLEAGVNVISAQDDVNDPYYPFGKPDQLEVAQYMAHVAQLTYPPQLETVLDMVTVNAARAMRLEGYGTEPGDRADLILLDAPTVHEALRLLPPRRLVFYGGRLLAESRLETAFHAAPAAA
ncbi:MAG: cytosine/creatinine deaminase [Solirubrobacteraceae bacterium]|nr:cytosine/creatinine deaminase [Solirubrobacteraceae bacterium]